MKNSAHALALLAILLHGIQSSPAQALPPATIAFSTQNYVVNEGAGLAFITVNLARSNGNGNGEVVAVQYYTYDGTATSDDYEPVNSALAFAAGETSKTFTIPIVNDTEVEGNETIFLVLTNATCGASLPSGVSSTTARLVIVDNDFAPGQLNFSSDIYTRSEADGSAAITVTRTGGNSGVVTVQYYTENGTAMAGLDYESVSGILAFADGQTSQTFIVPILPDLLVEPEQTVVLILTNATGGSTFAGGLPSITARLTIQDSNGPAVARPIIGGFEREDSLLRFRFTVEPSYDYFVEFSESCFGNNWLSLTNVRAKNQTVEAVVTDSLTNATNRFYRIRKQDCGCD